MSHNSALPQDIYDNVIDSLRDDKPSLKVCSLVDSAWRKSSQKHLHRAMVFRTSLPLPAGDSVVERLPVTSGPERTHFLLNTSFHLLQYVRSVVIRGDRETIIRRCGNCKPKPPKPRTPDLSLVVFLRDLVTFALPLLATVELRDLTWTAINTDLQRALVSLFSGRSIKEVRLFSCGFPVSVQWLRFVGPETRSLKVYGVTMTGDLSDEHDAPFEDLPISSAPNLMDLDMGPLSLAPMVRWILHSFKAPGDPGDTSNSKTAVLHGRSWHESITTISLHCRAGTKGLFELVQACPRLTTLRLNPQSCVTSFPFYPILRIPTLEYLHILRFSSGRISWLISCFKTFDSLPPSPYRTAPTKLRTIDISMWFEPGRAASKLSRISLPEVLVKLRELDGVVGSLPHVEVNLTMTVSMFGLEDGPRRMEYDEAKVALVGLRADLKALKLEVS